MLPFATDGTGVERRRLWKNFGDHVLCERYKYLPFCCWELPLVDLAQQMKRRWRPRSSNSCLIRTIRSF